jgi:hypothetical protein
MASAQGGDGSNDNDNNDLACVYRAVDEGASAEQVRAILAGGPRTRREKVKWLAAVTNHKSAANNDETPLKAAHRRRDGPLVGALLEHGAKARSLFPNANALAICISYGLVDSLRVLLRSGRHSADERLAYWARGTVAGLRPLFTFCRPVHLCVVPPRFPGSSRRQPPQIECLNVLVREFGADVNGMDEPDSSAPLHWLWWAPSAEEERRAFDALMALGADVQATDQWGRTCIFHVRDPGVLQQLLARGVSPNVIATNGTTPLSSACDHESEAIVSALLPLTLTETRRAVNASGYSALDKLAQSMGSNPPPPWKLRAIQELLSSRVPVRASVLPIVARFAERREAELARRNRSGAMHWRAHEDMVGLAFDFKELREAEEAVRVREARVQKLEEELQALGVGTEDTDEDEEEEEDNSGEEDKDDDEKSGSELEAGLGALAVGREDREEEMKEEY